MEQFELDLFRSAVKPLLANAMRRIAEDSQKYFDNTLEVIEGPDQSHVGSHIFGISHIYTKYWLGFIPQKRSEPICCVSTYLYDTDKNQPELAQTCEKIINFLVLDKMIMEIVMKEVNRCAQSMQSVAFGIVVP